MDCGSCDVPTVTMVEKTEPGSGEFDDYRIGSNDVERSVW